VTFDFSIDSDFSFDLTSARVSFFDFSIDFDFSSVDFDLNSGRNQSKNHTTNPSEGQNERALM